MLILSFAWIALSWPTLASDKYANFKELAAAEKEGIDFNVTVIDRKAPVTVMAIHGGGIEFATSELARKLAGEDSNLYLFEGHKGEEDWNLHLTSTHFDEPRALELAGHSVHCLSIHGYVGEDKATVCLGGGDAEGRKRIAKALRNSGLDIGVESPCRALPGTDPENIVNRCQFGIQLELSEPLRERLRDDPDFGERFVRVIRKNR